MSTISLSFGARATGFVQLREGQEKKRDFLEKIRETKLYSFSSSIKHYLVILS